MRPTEQLLIVGNPEEHHVGSHFLSAAGDLGLEASLVDLRDAGSKNIWINRLFQRIAKRPAYLRRFSRKVTAACRELRPRLVIVTGISPPADSALDQIGRMGIHRANYLTDDPWNRMRQVAFFWKALRRYDTVWSPRRANLEQLRAHGCTHVAYLPFGYNPKLHFLEAPRSATEVEKFTCDALIVGGADADRIPVASGLANAGLRIALCGGYWDRNRQLAPFWRGSVYGRDLRIAVGAASVNVCIVRKANRDGHSMRSFELPAMGACMVVEDTPDHRGLFGEDGECVLYFSNLSDLVGGVKTLRSHPERAQALRNRAFERICRHSGNTYADRLQKMLRTVIEAEHE
jgi:spore maturation protein CgeB